MAHPRFGEPAPEGPAWSGRHLFEGLWLRKVRVRGASTFAAETIALGASENLARFGRSGTAPVAKPVANFARLAWRAPSQDRSPAKH
jgi:hypothetical protein